MTNALRCQTRRVIKSAKGSSLCMMRTPRRCVRREEYRARCPIKRVIIRKAIDEAGFKACVRRANNQFVRPSMGNQPLTRLHLTLTYHITRAPKGCHAHRVAGRASRPIKRLVSQKAIDNASSRHASAGGITGLAGCRGEIKTPLTIHPRRL